MIALVLGAGGPVGYAFHAGVLAGLSDAGWDARSADLVVGTSIGAVSAGLLRAGMDPIDLFARVARTPLSPQGAALLQAAGGWPSFPAPADTGAPRWGRPASLSLIATLARHPRRIRPGLALAALGNPGTVNTDPIRAGFDRLGGGRWPAGTWICAVDLDTGGRVTFGAPGAPVSTVGEAVAASCAVPGYFAPVSLDGRRFVDGGVVSPANSDLVGGLDGLEAVVVSVPMGRHGPAGRRGIDLPGRDLNHAQARRGLRPLAEAGVPVLMVEPTARELEVMHYDAFDQAHLPAIAARTRATLLRRFEAAASGEGGDATAAALAALLSGPARLPETVGADGPAQPIEGTGTGASGPT
ncbi:patatin-like phospholipase family protein [Acidiferrimicrobium sp. IK]|uniref:patatin-like phospholipase family protein n=1 Tax=Acidiferrimicrobium sp. IK TaxID=2871700 RepID=UPI0021CAE379|nr:patatin-like phospholipase family protein [Acidiferrimicrobium sp. IK]MCU4184548.1 patatin-like phospholipase family protein [Acidiferrimicrobium sp. IK]